MRNRNRRWLFAWAIFSSFLQVFQCEVIEPAEIKNSTLHKNDTTPSTKETRGLFSPRMDYEQWTPLGRGDPLKNDPTYDYVPPVLERVHYWIEPALRKPDPPLPTENQKTEILVLGVSSKKPSTGTSVADTRDEDFDPFLKFVEAPKFNVQNNYQRIARPHYLTSSYFPSPFYVNKSKQPSYLGKGEQPVPNTMLMPPPIPTVRPTLTTVRVVSSKPPTSSVANKQVFSTPSVSIDHANLIFQSSSVQNSKWESNKYATVPDASNIVTWKTTLPQESNSLSDATTTLEYTTKQDIQKPAESYMHLEQMFVEPADNSTNKHINENLNIKHILENSPSMIKNEEQISGPDVMYKGQVTDGDLDIASTYVNIGKSEAQMDTSSGLGVSSVSVAPPKLAEMPPMLMGNPYQHMIVSPMHPPQKQLKIPPMTLQTLQTMQTMQPPPLPVSDKSNFIKASSLQSLLQKEATKPLPPVKMFTTTSHFTTTTSTSTTMPPPTSPSPTTTTAAALTTDPLFKHYKQPIEPIRGPMYLIIQGHSKVKTYGPTKQVHGISVQETNEIPTSDENMRYSVKHLHNYKKEGNDDRIRSGRSSNLQTLTHVVQTGLGAIDFAEIPANRRNDEDIRETELEVRYDVSGRRDTTSEKYYKGIVEAGELARKIRDEIDNERNR